MEHSPQKSRRPLALKAALFALSIVAMTTQVGGATAAPGVGAPATHASATLIPLPDERELLAWLARLTGALHGPPVSGSWALLIAGISGVWAIGRRRTASLRSHALDLHRLQRQ
jgi:hypothetical protein